MGLQIQWGAVSENYRNEESHLNEQQLIALAAQGDDRSIIQLADQYLPVVLKLRRQYFIRNFDDEDWLQEARIAIHRAAKQYDAAQPCSFGAFYRLLLSNQVIDLIRRSQAKKRRPEQEVVSLDTEEEDGLSNVLVTTLSAVDVVYVHEQLVEFARVCSHFEAQVFAAMLTGMTPQGIAVMLQVELAPVTNAADRCRRKLRRLLLSQTWNWHSKNSMLMLSLNYYGGFVDGSEKSCTGMYRLWFAKLYGRRQSESD